MLSDTLLRRALESASQSGAEYAEARAEDTLVEAINVRNGAVERLSTDRDTGWGIHALANGGWGFASSSSDTPGAIRDTAQRAVEIARASATRRKSRSDLSLMSTERGEYATGVERDPFSVPVAERLDL